MEGRIHSIQSMGAVDGPGLRMVVFFQGCPLRCIYCHNPDTWPMDGGEERSVEELVALARRYRPYLKQGGVTLSGGEVLAQAPFAAALLQALQEDGFHTCIDTSGCASGADARRVLQHTDLALLDIKFTKDFLYRRHCGMSLGQVMAFGRLAGEMGVPLWVRHVVVPGLTDGADNIRALNALVRQLPTVEKVELLPFHKLCVEKYDRLGIPFPLRDTPACEGETIRRLTSLLESK